MGGRAAERARAGDSLIGTIVALFFTGQTKLEGKRA
jgi:hypothetical protein